MPGQALFGTTPTSHMPLMLSQNFTPSATAAHSPRRGNVVCRSGSSTPPPERPWYARYPSPMPRPSRLVEAQEKLRARYAENGLMPSLTGLAELLGLRGASSVQELAAELVNIGFLARDDRAGRLIPGPSFGAESKQSRTVPAELVKALPEDVALEVARITADSMMADGILQGDFLVLAPAERTDLSKTLLVARGLDRALAQKPAPGWQVLGVVVAQFRSYE